MRCCNSAVILIRINAKCAGKKKSILLGKGITKSVSAMSVNINDNTKGNIDETVSILRAGKREKI